MDRRIRIGASTAGALAVLGTIEALLCLAVTSQWRVVTSPGPASLAEALTLVVVVLAAALGAWLLLSTVTALVAHLPGRLGTAAQLWANAWAPLACRRVAAVLVGAALGGAVAPGTALGDGPSAPSPGFSATATASATTASSTPVVAPVLSSPALSSPGFADTSPTPAGPGFTATGAGVETWTAPEPASTEPATPTEPASEPAPGWTPSRPLQRPQPEPGLVTAGSAPHGAAVVVHRGETLWDITRRHLGPDASDAEVANAWPAWHDANRAVIGDDPDLILPGQILRPPRVLTPTSTAPASAPISAPASAPAPASAAGSAAGQPSGVAR